MVQLGLISQHPCPITGDTSYKDQYLTFICDYLKTFQPSILNPEKKEGDVAKNATSPLGWGFVNEVKVYFETKYSE